MQVQHRSRRAADASDDHLAWMVRSPRRYPLGGLARLCRLVRGCIKAGAAVTSSLVCIIFERATFIRAQNHHVMARSNLNFRAVTYLDDSREKVLACNAFARERELNSNTEIRRRADMGDAWLAVKPSPVPYARPGQQHGE